MTDDTQIHTGKHACVEPRASDLCSLGIAPSPLVGVGGGKANHPHLPGLCAHYRQGGAVPSLALFPGLSCKQGVTFSHWCAIMVPSGPIHCCPPDVLLSCCRWGEERKREKASVLLPSNFRKECVVGLASSGNEGCIRPDVQRPCLWPV